MTRRLSVESLPASLKDARAVILLVSRALSRPAPDAQSILARLPATLPKAFDDDEALELANGIRELGGTADFVEETSATKTCATHADLDGDLLCERCEAPACLLCAAGPKPLRCEKCATRASRSRRAYLVRVSVLLGMLAAVLVYAFRDVSSRRARHAWDHTLQIAVVVLRLDAVDDDATHALRRGLDNLDARLAEELRRRRPDAPKPFAFSAFGPVDVTTGPPSIEGDGVIDLARHAWDLRRYLHSVDAAAEVSQQAFDARIYVLVRRPKNSARSVVEGESEQDGRVGTVTVELSRDMVDLALIVVGHELFHTLGATDKYDANGRTLIPDGLADPDRVPRFPQPFVEIMARNRPMNADEERIPDGLGELAVGPITAREIGWIK